MILFFNMLPCIFDSDNEKFHENRSNQQNDLLIVKNLRSKKSKKGLYSSLKSTIEKFGSVLTQSSLSKNAYL